MDCLPHHHPYPLFLGLIMEGKMVTRGGHTMGPGIVIMTGIGIIGNETVDEIIHTEVQEDRDLELQRVSTDFYDFTKGRSKRSGSFCNFYFLSFFLAF